MYFIEFSSSTWAAFTAIVLVAAFVKGLTGFAFALLAAPLFLLVLPAKEVVAIDLLMVTWIGLLITTSSWRHVQWRLTLPLSVASFVGIPVGTYIIAHVSPSSLRLLIAAVVILFSIPLLLGYSMTFKKEKRACALFGFLSGVLASSTSLSGPPVVLFLVNQGLDKQALRATLASFLCISSLASLISLLFVGLLPVKVVNTGLVMFPLCMVGVYLGQGIMKRIEVTLFRRLAVLLVLASGISAMIGELL